MHRFPGWLGHGDLPTRESVGLRLGVFPKSGFRDTIAIVSHR